MNKPELSSKFGRRRQSRPKKVLNKAAPQPSNKCGEDNTPARLRPGDLVCFAEEHKDLIPSWANGKLVGLILEEGGGTFVVQILSRDEPPWIILKNWLVRYVDSRDTGEVGIP